MRSWRRRRPKTDRATCSPSKKDRLKPCPPRQPPARTNCGGKSCGGRTYRLYLEEEEKPLGFGCRGPPTGGPTGRGARVSSEPSQREVCGHSEGSLRQSERKIRCTRRRAAAECEWRPQVFPAFDAKSQSHLKVLCFVANAHEGSLKLREEKNKRNLLAGRRTRTIIYANTQLVAMCCHHPNLQLLCCDYKCKPLAPLYDRVWREFKQRALPGENLDGLYVYCGGRQITHQSLLLECV